MEGAPLCVTKKLLFCPNNKISIKFVLKNKISINFVMLI